MQSGKQNRIPLESKFDGRGISSEAYNKLGCDPMGKQAVRTVDNSVWTSDICTMRIITSYIHRLQGTYFHISLLNYCDLNNYYSLYLKLNK